MKVQSTSLDNNKHSKQNFTAIWYSTRRERWCNITKTQITRETISRSKLVEKLQKVKEQVFLTLSSTKAKIKPTTDDLYFIDGSFNKVGVTLTEKDALNYKAAQNKKEYLLNALSDVLKFEDLKIN